MRYLGTIVAATHTAKDNTTTAAPFAIPPTTRNVVVIPDQDVTVLAGSAPGDNATANDFPIPSGNGQPPTVTGMARTSAPTLSVYSTGGSTATVKVYALNDSIFG